jgi:hypothetical protein
MERVFPAISGTSPSCFNVSLRRRSGTLRAAVETRLTHAQMSTIIEPLIAATRGGTSIDQEGIAA